jgi:murein DD-endopeptidase MepM/ murein hydrolase activator NlpD
LVVGSKTSNLDKAEVSMPKRLVISLLVFATLAVSTGAMPAAAAPPPQAGDVYVVQAGDTLSSIAARFGLKLSDIAAANSLSNTNLIFVGQRLVLPASQPPASPTTGSSASSASSIVYVVQAGDTLFSIATRFGVKLADVALVNSIQDANYIYVGQRLLIPTPVPSAAEIKYPAPFAAVALSPTPVAQGQTLVVRVTLSQPSTLTGQFDGRPLYFTGDDHGGWAVVGIHALQEVKVYSMTLRARLADGAESVTTVPVLVMAGPYPTEDIQLAPGREDLLAPDLTQAEQARLSEVFSAVSPRPLWEGLFGLPLTSIRITSPFGGRRSYNEGPVSGFHAGLDLGGASGTPIYAAAAGRVALAEKLTVRGNAVVIDHGMGVFTGYWHQSQLVVQTGQTVQRGDIIGYVGDTGLVSGPHLHWEMRVGGIAVDPMQWTQMAIP